MQADPMNEWPPKGPIIKSPSQVLPPIGHGGPFWVTSFHIRSFLSSHRLLVFHYLLMVCPKFNSLSIVIYFLLVKGQAWFDRDPTCLFSQWPISSWVYFPCCNFESAVIIAQSLCLLILSMWGKNNVREDRFANDKTILYFWALF